MKYTKKTHQAVGILRDRGQVTIPYSFRNTVDWLNPSTVLSFMLEDEETLVIRPQKPAVDWEKIEALRAKTLKMKGGSSESTVSFLRRDRQSH